MGLPGVGKTQTSLHLYRQIQHSQYIDADELWRIHPFIVDEHNKEMIESNIKHLYQGFINNPNLETLLFSWVIPNEYLYHSIQDWFSQTENTFVLLHCDAKEYKKRLISDNRNLEQINRAEQINQQYRNMNIHRIDTTTLSINEVSNILLNKYILGGESVE